MRDSYKLKFSIVAGDFKIIYIHYGIFNISSIMNYTRNCEIY